MEKYNIKFNEYEPKYVQIAENIKKLINSRVIKDGDKITYFGGKSQQMEKNTRVKVRVKAHALKQILDNNENIINDNNNNNKL